MFRRIISAIISILVIASLAAFVIAYSRGYRVNLGQKTFESTGILSVSSYPDRASVLIDGKLASATNASLSLIPGWYQVKISKEGYQSWEKKVRIQGEVVSQIDALLIPTNPSLRALTVTGVLNPILSPTGSKVAYIIPEEVEAPPTNLDSNAGVWIFELRTGPLGGKIEPRNIFQSKISLDLKSAEIFWSPDEKEIVLLIKKTASGKETVSTALQLSTETNSNSVPLNIIGRYSDILDNWKIKTIEKEAVQITDLAPPISTLLSTSTSNIRFSPDETKILYLATASATLSPVITPALIGSNTTEEVRAIEPDKFYIYDSKEDKNFFIADKNSLVNPESLLWYSDSKHLVLIEEDAISIIDYDGTNKRAVYSGPFEDGIVYSWPFSNKLVILANLNNPQNLPNLYEVDLR